MHALDPAKVHLDRIALHYAVLQRCSISYGATNRWRRVETGERGRNGTSGDLVRLPCHHPASRSPTVQGSSDLYVLPMWPSPCDVVPFLERQRGNACLIIYAAQVAWNFTVSYIILARAFSRAWTPTSLANTVYMRACVHMCVCMSEGTAKVTASYVRELLHVGFLGHMRLIS